jgi:protein SCO1/2
MKIARTLLVAALVAGCMGRESEKPVTEPGEKLYTVRGRILSRSATENTIRTDHEAIPGFMPAMVMDYSVRGQDVARLPPDNSRFEARLHVTDRAYWITDVKAIP